MSQDVRQTIVGSPEAGRAMSGRDGNRPAPRPRTSPPAPVAEVKRRLSRLWQGPLLILSIILFGVAAYLFIDPRGGATIEQKIEAGRIYLRQERAEAALEHLNRLLARERLEKDREADVHLLIAESLAMAQKQKKINIPENHRRIIEQVTIALELGSRPSAEVNLRLAESHEALGRATDALLYYRRAMMMMPDKSLRLQRRIIDLQLGADDQAGAAGSLDDYLADKRLTDSERSWAMGESAHLMIDRGEFSEARKTLEEALRLNIDPVDRGQIGYWLGYCEYKLNQLAQAERCLRSSREQLKVKHPLDAEAAYLLGRIAQEQNRPEEAISFFEIVLTSHPDARIATMARLGRGVCRIASGQDDPGLTDLHDVTAYIGQRDVIRRKYRVEALVGLKQAAQALATRENFQGALEVMGYEQSLAAEGAPNPAAVLPASFYGRLAVIYEKRSDQIERQIPDSVKPAERIRREQQVRDLRSRSGDAYVAWSKALTLTDDKGYAEAMWKGIELYDRAGDLSRTIAALELFVAERPEDPLAPEALLRAGRAYQAAGLYDKAISAYQRNQLRYPNTLAASKSAVPLAQAYIAKGTEFYGKAETVLMGVVDNNPLITPAALEFKQALFELAQLYYRTGRYEDAVARLEELTARYPKDERTGQLVFLMGDSYRKSAGMLAADKPEPQPRTAAAKIAATRPATQPATPDPVEIAAARRERLNKARELFERTIEVYRRTPAANDTDKLYQKLAHFYRADCVFDLGNFEESIRLYDAAAFRYQDDPSALAAYVQIVNAYCALGRHAEAKTANERAKWLLRKMPPESFAEGGFTMPREYWNKWLEWTSTAGMWD